MLNEAAQWAATGIVLILLLGLFRQVALTLPPDRRATPEGPPVGRRASAELLRAIEGLGLGHDGQGITVAFVSEGCVGCQRLLAQLPPAMPNLKGSILLVADKPSVAFAAALEEIGAPVIADDGHLWAACQVTATPLVIHLDVAGKVTRKEVTHDVRNVTPAKL